MIPCLLLLAACSGPDATAPADIELRLGGPTGKVISPLHFGANIEFSRPGVFAGTLPASDPRSKRKEFAAALRQSGVRALRLPGGNAAYYYLPESRELSMTLAHAIGHWEFRDGNPACRDFVTLESLASFCREHGIALIYQLPVLFHLDGLTPRATIPSRYSKKAKNYDRDRIEAGADYAASVARRLLDLKAPVAAWELGNEEFAHCGATDYARIAAAIAERVHKLDPATPIVAVGMGKEWLPECVGELRRLGALHLVRSFNAHYPFGHWPGPPTPADRANPIPFALGDVRIERWLDAASKGRRTLGIPHAPIAVTETMVFRHKSWEPTPLVPTHAHALLYAWNWMAMLADPRCDMAVFHDLETTFFGMMRFDVGYDAATRRFVWLAGAKPGQKLRRFPKQYVLSPTCAASRLLARLAGGRLRQVTLTPPDPTTRAIAGETNDGRRVILVVRRSAESATLALPGLRIARADALTADGLGAALPGHFRVTRLTPLGRRRDKTRLPPWSVTAITASLP